MNYSLFFLLILFVIIILLYILKNKKKSFENYSNKIENVPENIGNVLCNYFYNYSISILEQKDFIFDNSSNSLLFKYLPSKIKFNKEIYLQFKKIKEINIQNLKKTGKTGTWYCSQQWIIDFWNILKPTIHDILDDCLRKSNLYRKIEYPIIHFRCADTPFLRHFMYTFQKYQFFKEALKKIENENKKVYMLSNNTHISNNKEQESCKEYSLGIKEYIEELGYECEIYSNTNIEDFADLFYAPYVISTGGSYSFMSGFFGNGFFISTDHCMKEDNVYGKCNINDDNFIKGYNIRHSDIESYYEIDNVKDHLYS